MKLITKINDLVVKIIDSHCALYDIIKYGIVLDFADNE